MCKNLGARKLGILEAKVRDESVKEGRDTHEGPWSQAKELSSQRGPMKGLGQGCDPIRFVLPKMIRWVRAKQTGCMNPPGCLSYCSSLPASRDSAHPPGTADALCAVWGPEPWPEERTLREEETGWHPRPMRKIENLSSE